MSDAIDSRKITQAETVGAPGVPPDYACPTSAKPARTADDELAQIQPLLVGRAPDGPSRG